MKIAISGLAAVFTPDGIEVRKPSILKQLNGMTLVELTPQDIGREWTRRGITGGTVSLTFSTARRRLIVVTELVASAPLSLSDLQTLCDRAVMEWCDGYAECRVVRFDDGSELTIDCSPSDADDPEIRVGP